MTIWTRITHLQPTSAPARQAQLVDPGFGRVFTDHMSSARFSRERGWHDFRVTAHEELAMAPASLALHYAQEIFEGLKAFRMPDGGVSMFRPDANARRFRHSARRLAMEPLPEELFLESLHELVDVDREWLPEGDDGSLYLRPFQIADESALGMRPSASFRYCVIASPVRAYFKGGSAPVKLWATRTYSRAAPGGTGDAKCGGNYAASLAAMAEAIQNGCDHAVFLDATERRWIEEIGGMNIFFVFDDGTLLTPPLGGTILAGVTRDSLMTLARELGHDVREEPYTIDQWAIDARNGRMTESFACGTAAVVTPVGSVQGPEHEFTIGGNAAGPVTEKLRAALVEIQRGVVADRHGWLSRVEHRDK